MATSAIILGLNCVYHESSACLVQGSRLLAFAEQERFNRIKHGKPALIDNADHLPTEAISYCLREAGISLSDISYIAVSFDPDLRAPTTNEPTVRGSWGHPEGEAAFVSSVRRIPERLSEFAGTDLTHRVQWVPHEYAHAASAYYASPYSDAAILALDGIGDGSTGLLAHGTDTKLKEISWLRYPNSVGFLWEKFAKFVGLGEYDAAKVMALAAFANPGVFAPSFTGFLRDADGNIAMDVDTLCFRTEDYTALEALFGPRRIPGGRIDTRDAQIAAALQQATEGMLLEFCRELAEVTGSENLCMAGGVALNCVANGRLAKEGPFRSLFIQPMAHDAGTALGAALHVSHNLCGVTDRFEMVSPYLGPHYDERDMETALREGGLAYQRLDNAPHTVARLLAAGHIGGWFQGAAEVGPRALGNRSILADPRRPGTKELINLRIKHREYFRPFAPSVLSEAAGEWFEISATSLSQRFMSFAFPVRPEKRGQVPAILHVDGTSRLQSVSTDINPKYHALISEFHRITDVPMVLNTSFNTYDEPIVLSPADAIRTFLRTGMDFLAMGDFLVTGGAQHNLVGREEVCRL